MRTSTWVLLTVLAMLALRASQQADAAEFRGFRVDAWGSGYESPTATTTMLDYVQACNCNAFIVEVRERGDVYCTSSPVPTGINITPDSGCDRFAGIATKPHGRAVEVHARVAVHRVRIFTTPPATTHPDHVFSIHPGWFHLTNGDTRLDSGNNSYPRTTLGCKTTSVARCNSEQELQIVQRLDFERLCSVQHRVPLIEDKCGRHTRLVGLPLV